MSQVTHYIAEAVSKYVAEPDQAFLIGTISAYDNTAQANAELYDLTGIQHFFPGDEAFEEFRLALKRPALSTDRHQSRQWGDFQTPPEMVAQVCQYLVDQFDYRGIFCAFFKFC